MCLNIGRGSMVLSYHSMSLTHSYKLSAVTVHLELVDSRLQHCSMLVGQHESISRNVQRDMTPL